MNRRLWFQVASGMAGAAMLGVGRSSEAVQAAREAAIRLGKRRELFVDRYLIDRLEGTAALSLARPRDEGIVYRFDRPWEGAFCGYATVLQDGPRLRLYYRGNPKVGRDGSPTEVTCYAESTDGRTWQRPEQGE